VHLCPPRMPNDQNPGSNTGRLSYGTAYVHT
jgi:hypothetical protein